MPIAKYLLFVLLFISFLQACDRLPEGVPISKKETPLNILNTTDTSCLTAYVTLDLESAAYLKVSEKEYAIVDTILAEASHQITPQVNYTKKEALAILKIIYNILQKHQIRSSSYHGSFAMCLRFGIFDCDINTLLYLTIAEHLQLPIKAVLMPSHITVLWSDTNNLIYWETLTGKMTTLAYYLRLYEVDTATIGKSMQFVPLERRAVLAVNCYNIGTTFIESGNYDQAIPFLRTAMYLTPDWFKPYSGMAYLYNEKKLPDNAIYYVNQSLIRFKKQYDLLKIKGEAYQKLGCDTEAVEEYEYYLTQLPKTFYNYQQERQQIIGRIDSLDW